ncbi:hypothetical protein OG884_05605 [Streptosporangium sp. NBC_01755]|uniref:hypothetical protein n=1 Tax=Streptosporangium sp. NBC_01755 TaxID=2975949 RepID=UPI002DDBF5A0|nr:hypothetical protein [Streptosporangium sp. NBC_01755]WSD01400.1 hypothetical protein OG884_05605 [Streptosporangium sp. NBC_01755]
MIPCTHDAGSTAVARPKTGTTPIRRVRLGDEIWEQVERAAGEDDTTNTAIVKEALADYFAKRARQKRARRLAEAQADDSRDPA